MKVWRSTNAIADVINAVECFKNFIICQAVADDNL